MTAAAIVEIVTWAAKAVQAIVEFVQEAIKKAEPPTSAELKKTLHDIIEARHEDWVKAGKEAADQALIDAAKGEFENGLKDALADKDKD